MKLCLLTLTLLKLPLLKNIDYSEIQINRLYHWALRTIFTRKSNLILELKTHTPGCLLEVCLFTRNVEGK